MVLRAPDPAHVLPIVRHREIALALEALLLHVAPVVIGAPDDPAGEARLEGDGARAVIAAQRNPLEADPLRVDVVARLEPVDDLARPNLRIVDGVQALKAERLAGSRLIDDEGRDAALGEPARQADAVFHLLCGIEAVELDKDRRAPLDAFGAGVKRRQMGFAVRDLDALAVLVRKPHAAIEERTACACRGRGVPARCAPAGARPSDSRSLRARTCRRPKSAGRVLRPLRQAHRACRPFSTRSRGRRLFRRRRAAWRPPAEARTSPRSRQSWRPSRSRDRRRGSRRSWSGST